MADIKDREIFKVGKWNASTGPIDVTSAMLDEVVAAYDGLNSKVSGYAIPIKLGHNRRVGEPAYGYAQNVRRDGDTLLADFTDVPSEIVDAINQKRYNAVSVELHPKVGDFNNVLGGVALLGAEWPAVKGLKPVYASEFAAGAALMLSQEEDEMPQTFTQEQADAFVAAAEAKVRIELTAKVEAAEAAKTAAEAERDTAVAALAVFQDEKELGDMTVIIEAAEKAGKIIPANKDKVTAFASALRKTIPAGERAAVLTMFKEFVDGLPAKVEFGENGADKSEQGGVSATDQVMEAVKKRQVEAGGAKKLPFKAALEQVFAEDEDLKNRYVEENR